MWSSALQKEQLVHMMEAIRVVATSNTCSSTNQVAAIQCIREASKIIAVTSTKFFVVISRDLLGILAQQSVATEVHNVPWLRASRSVQTCPPPSHSQSCLHCLSEVLPLIGAHLIPLLSGIVPTVLQFVDTAVDRWCDVGVGGGRISCDV